MCFVCSLRGSGKTHATCRKFYIRFLRKKSSPFLPSAILSHNVLHEPPNIDGGIGYPQWKLTLCLAGCYLLLFLILWKGVASSGKAAYFTGTYIHNPKYLVKR